MSLLDLIAPGKKKRQAAQNSTQTHLKIAEIKDDVVVLKNGGMRAVIKTSSINFNLKSEDEQNAIIQGYQGFLNSLEFPVQILVRSKKLDIDNYIKQIEELGHKQENKLLQGQTFEYADYIKRLVEYADIMEKQFYVIVPYDSARTAGSSSFQGFFQRLSPKDSYSEVKKRHAEFGKVKKSLNQRINTVKAGLEQCGLTVEQLDTMQLIELYYSSYNPKTSRSAKIEDIGKTNLETDEKEEKN